MKNILLLFAVICTSSIVTAQKKEKIKGSNIVTVENKEIGDFENIEVSDTLEIFLFKGDKNAIEVEADDNLHPEIEFKLTGNTLFISALKDITSAKKTSVRITYTDQFKMLIARDKSKITSLSDLNLSEFTFKCYNDSKLFLNANVAKFTLITNDKSKVELNLKSEDAVLELSKNSNIKALITSSKLKCDMYQKTIAVIEGDVNELRLRIDNSSNFTGKNLTTKTATAILEASAVGIINVATTASLELSGKTELYLYGDAAVDIKVFKDEAMIFKKPLK
jgi:hypothetical protein